MATRALLLPALLAVLVVAPARGDIGDQKAAVDAKIAALHSKIASAQAKAASLSSQIGSLTSQIHSLERRVGNVSAQLATLQSDLSLHQRRLDKLNELYHLQTVWFHYLRREYALALH